MTQEIEVGIGKTARLCYSLDDISVVPSRRTRDPEDVDTSWQIDAYSFDIPVIGAPISAMQALPLQVPSPPSGYWNLTQLSLMPVLTCLLYAVLRFLPSMCRQAISP